MKRKEELERVRGCKGAGKETDGGTVSPVVSESRCWTCRQRARGVSPALQIAAQYALRLSDVSADVYARYIRARGCTGLQARTCAYARVSDGAGRRARLSLGARDWLYRFCAVAGSRHLVARASTRVL